MKLLMPLQLLLVFLIWAASAQPLKIGEAAGTIDLVSPEGLPVAMNNYSERRGTAVLFLSTRDAGTDAAAESLGTLNQQFRRRRIIPCMLNSLPKLTPPPANSYAGIRTLCVLLPQTAVSPRSFL